MKHSPLTGGRASRTASGSVANNNAAQSSTPPPNQIVSLPCPHGDVAAACRYCIHRRTCRIYRGHNAALNAAYEVHAAKMRAAGWLASVHEVPR